MSTPSVSTGLTSSNQSSNPYTVKSTQASSAISGISGTSRPPYATNSSSSASMGATGGPIQASSTGLNSSSPWLSRTSGGSSSLMTSVGVSTASNTTRIPSFTTGVGNSTILPSKSSILPFTTPSNSSAISGTSAPVHGNLTSRYVTTGRYANSTATLLPTQTSGLGGSGALTTLSGTKPPYTSNFTFTGGQTRTNGTGSFTRGPTYHGTAGE